jgi:hypothetical protein
MDVKAVHYCVRYTMRELLWSPDTNLTAGDIMHVLQKAIKAHPALDFSPEGGSVRNSQGIPVRLSGFLSSPTSHIPPEIFLSPFCHLFSHIITKGGSNFFYLRIPWELSLENFLHLIPQDLLFLLYVKYNTRGLIIH